MQLCEVLLSANIPLAKLKLLKLKNVFAKNFQRLVFDKSTLKSKYLYVKMSFIYRLLWLINY